VINAGDGTSFLEPAEDDFPVESSLNDLLHRNFIGNVSVVYRGGLVPEIPEAFRRVVHQDWPLHVLHARQGRIGYLPEVMAVWRHHARGMWSAQPESRRWEWIFESYDLMEDLLGPGFRDTMRAVRRDAVRKVCAERERALQSRDFRYGRALLRPVRAVRRLLRSGASRREGPPACG
jgi:hypothetical protein